MTDFLKDLDSEHKACAEENVQRLYDRWGFPLIMIFWVVVIGAGVIIND